MGSKIEIEQLYALHFAELTALYDSYKGKHIKDFEAKNLERKLGYLEEQIHKLQQNTAIYNSSHIEKKDRINLSQFDAAINIIDILYKQVYVGGNIESSTSNIVTLPLPNFQLPCFDGNVESWAEFKELFDVLIDKNTTLTDIQKFSYLRSQLKREPLTLISAYDFIPSNYEIAYSALKQRYDSSRRHASFLVKKMFANKLSSKDIPHALECIRASITNLKKIQTPDLGDYLLFELAYNSCDEHIQKSFDNAHASSTLPSTATFLAHLESMARIQELKFDVNVNKPVNLISKSTKSRSFVTQSTTKGKCPICFEEHLVYKCNKFLSWSTQERFDAVRKFKLCFNCLSQFHDSRTCKSLSTCSKCKKNHHTLLHFEEKRHKSETIVSKEIPSTSNANAVLASTSLVNLPISSFTENYALLGTIVCLVKDNFGVFHPVRCLLDNASQRSLITTRLVKRLGLKLEPENRHIIGVDSSKSRSLGSVHLELRSRFNKREVLFCKATSLIKFCEDMPIHDLSVSIKRNFENIPLADDNFFKKQPVDILLGTIEYASLLSQRTPNLIKGKPSAICTRFGWVVFGCTPDNISMFNARNYHIQSTPLEENCIDSFNMDPQTVSISLEKTLTRFWEVEEVKSIISDLTPNDAFVEKHFLETHKRNLDGSFTVRLPFRSDANPE